MTVEAPLFLLYQAKTKSFRTSLRSSSVEAAVLSPVLLAFRNQEALAASFLCLERIFMVTGLSSLKGFHFFRLADALFAFSLIKACALEGWSI